MSKGRKAFGPTKKQACDLHHCKKKKQAPGYKAPLIEEMAKHTRIRSLPNT